MAAGFIVTKTQLDEALGVLSRDLRLALDRAKDLDVWLDTKSEGDLTALGYTTTEVAQMKSAFADADQLNSIFEGTANLSTAKDFRTFLKLFWGLGGIPIEP